MKTYGGYSVGPGSIHPNGKMYGEIINGDHIAVEEKDHFLEVIKPFLFNVATSASVRVCLTPSFSLHISSKLFTSLSTSPCV